MRNYVKAITGKIVDHTIQQEIFFFDDTDRSQAIEAVQRAHIAFDGAETHISVFRRCSTLPHVRVVSEVVDEALQS